VAVPIGLCRALGIPAGTARPRGEIPAPFLSFHASLNCWPELVPQKDRNAPMAADFSDFKDQNRARPAGRECICV